MRNVSPFRCTFHRIEAKEQPHVLRRNLLPLLLGGLGIPRPENGRLHNKFLLCCATLSFERRSNVFVVFTHDILASVLYPLSWLEYERKAGRFSVTSVPLTVNKHGGVVKVCPSRMRKRALGCGLKREAAATTIGWNAAFLCCCPCKMDAAMVQREDVLGQTIRGKLTLQGAKHSGSSAPKRCLRPTKSGLAG